MEQTFSASEWKPTKVSEPWDKPLPKADLEELIVRLATDQREIRLHPYDPRRWIRRAHTFTLLRYPELAVGDACKASLLCKSLLKVLNQNLKPNYRLGAHAGFWMGHGEREDGDGDEDEDDEVAERMEKLDIDTEHLTHRVRFLQIQGAADRVIMDNLEYAPNAEEGLFYPRPYPWMKAEHATRSDEILQQLNWELAHPLVTPLPALFVKRYAFGKGVGTRGGADTFGLFALRDIEKGEKLIVDRSRIWGCIGPGSGDSRYYDHDGLPAGGRASNLDGGYGCANFMHPNQVGDKVEHDLRWIRDRLGKDAAHTILLARLFLTCIRDRVDHPLSHPLIARLTPSYRTTVYKSFCLEKDITILMEVLQNFGIDIFANHNFDTWVLFEIHARVINNSWSDPLATCVSPLFSLINHSCEPNLSWNTVEGHSTLHVVANTHVDKDEQVFVEYDQFQHEKPLRVRRKRLEDWFDADCQCTRCVREELEEKAAGEGDGGGGGGGPGKPVWDLGVVVELPEDGDE
ncbi:hypothetical protein SMMN14_01482 [Sphaerulina musiva]